MVGLQKAGDDYSNYHLWIAWILADMALIGFNAGSRVYRRMRDAEKYRLVPRVVLAMTTCVVWTYWTYIIHNRFQKWEARVGRRRRECRAPMLQHSSELRDEPHLHLLDPDQFLLDVLPFYLGPTESLCRACTPGPVALYS